jgi:hypothetical protein
VVPIPDVTQSDPVRVIMLPLRVASSDPAAVAAAAAVRQSTLDALDAMSNVDIVSIGADELAAIVPRSAGPFIEDPLVYLIITHRYGGRVVAEISEIPEEIQFSSQSWKINLRVSAPGTWGGRDGFVRKNGDPRVGDDAASLGDKYAEQIADNLDRQSWPTPSPDARNIAFDATRSEDERLRSLMSLLKEGSDAAVIGATVDLATRSSSAETRQRAWEVLREGAYDPALVQPLSYALLADSDAAVRREAALGLAAYLGDGTLSATLEQASRNDASPEVRLAARMATMNYDEQQAFKRETLLDRSLAPAERLAPSVIGISPMAGRLGRSYGTAETEEALAYAEIMAAVEDPELKRRALGELQRTIFESGQRIGAGLGASDSKIAGALIETSRQADERLRRQALIAMGPMARNPDVRAVLESVLENEPELAGELDIADRLEVADQLARADRRRLTQGQLIPLR